MQPFPERFLNFTWKWSGVKSDRINFPTNQFQQFLRSRPNRILGKCWDGCAVIIATAWIYILLGSNFRLGFGVSRGMTGECFGTGLHAWTEKTTSVSGSLLGPMCERGISVKLWSVWVSNQASRWWAAELRKDLGLPKSIYQHPQNREEQGQDGQDPHYLQTQWEMTISIKYCCDGNESTGQEQ